MKTKTLLCSFLLASLFGSLSLFSQSETRQVGAFDKLNVEGPFNVELIEGEAGTVQLQGNRTDLESIITKVSQNTLVIKQKKGSWFSPAKMGSITLTIPINTLSRVTLSGSGDITADFPIEVDQFELILSGSGLIKMLLEANQVEATLTGSGQIKLSGQAQQTHFKVTGSGHLKTKELLSQNADSKITGSGSIVLHAKKNLMAALTGSGHIRCYGNPKEHKQLLTGSGSIVLKD